MTLFHGGEEISKHIGLCLTENSLSAKDYAKENSGEVFSATLDVRGLNIVDVDHLVDRDNQDYPGDSQSSIASLAASGIDVAVYCDETSFGRPHKCYRFITEAALEALVA